MKKPVIFANHYLIILIPGLILCSSIIHWLLCLVLAFIYFLVYHLTSLKLNNEIKSSEGEACKEIQKMLSLLQNINFQIMYKMSLSYKTDEDIYESHQDVLKDIESIIEKLEIIYSHIKTIKLILSEDFKGILKVRSSDISYIARTYLLIYNFDIYKFYEKYKDIDHSIDIDSYREDWFELYTNYHN